MKEYCGCGEGRGVAILKLPLKQGIHIPGPLLVPLDFVMVRIAQWALVSLVVPSWVSQDWGAAASDVLNVCFP